METGDLISRSALIAEYDRVHIGPPGGARKLMEEATAVDAVKVVRCWECLYGRKCESGAVICDLFRARLNSNAFCSYGERRKNAED